MSSHWMDPDSEEMQEALRESMACHGCNGDTLFFNWNGIGVEVCPSCQGEELSTYREALASDTGKKLMQILLQDFVQPHKGDGGKSPEFRLGQQSVYWHLVKMVEIAEKIIGRPTN